MSATHWVLYDPTSKMQTDQLTEEDTQFNLMKMKTSEIDNFLIWNSSWDKWKKLKDFLKTDESPFMTTFIGKSSSRVDDKSAPSSLKMTTANSDTLLKVQTSFSNVKVEEVAIDQVFNLGQQQFDADQINAEDGADHGVSFKSLNKRTAFARRGKEDEKKIELLLTTNKGQMFRSVAQNISLTGTFSEKIVPNEFHNIVFDIVIINNLAQQENMKRLQLKAKALITDASIYLQFMNMSDLQKNSLRIILDSYVNASKKMQSV